MSEAATTLDGWYCLHYFYAVDWTSWKQLSSDERQSAIFEFLHIVDKWNKTEEEKKGSHTMYTVVGQKADMMFMILRPSMDELNEIETEISKSKLADYLIPAGSYVSVVELSNYLPSNSQQNPYENPEIKARLYPILPKTKHICFYPMNKKREGNDNWYMLPMEERRKLMYTHGLTGRKYAGKVKQIVTGSVGYDDYEWGVTLFADDEIQIKKLVYEMRFDEVSARYAEFGPFYVGNLLDEQRIPLFLHVN